MKTVRKLIFSSLKPWCNKSTKIARFLFWIDREQYLLFQGASVGTRCRLEKFKFPSEPYLIQLGDHVSVGEGVQFITHDGGIWVIRELTDESKLDLFGHIKIGNNVFIGNMVILLPNIEVGDNVVIGAGAVITKNIPSNTVVAGCPAKILCTIENYLQRRKPQCLLTKGMSASNKRLIIGNFFSTTRKE